MNEPQMDWSVIIIAYSKLRGLLETLSQISNATNIFEDKIFWSMLKCNYDYKYKTIDFNWGYIA